MFPGNDSCIDQKLPMTGDFLVNVNSFSEIMCLTTYVINDLYVSAEKLYIIQIFVRT